MDVEIHLFFCYTIFIKGRTGVLSDWWNTRIPEHRNNEAPERRYAGRQYSKQVDAVMERGNGEDYEGCRIEEI